MFYCKRYPSHSRATTGGAVLPIMGGRPAETSWSPNDSHGAGGARPPISRPPPVLHSELGGGHPGPVGPGCSERVCDPVHERAALTLSSKDPGALRRGGGGSVGRGREHACKVGNRADHAQWAGISFDPISHSEERRQPEAGNKPEGSKRLCTYRALPGGWTSKAVESGETQSGILFSCL